MAILIPAKTDHWWCDARERLFAACLCIFGLTALVAGQARAGQSLPSEYEVKAAFLVNFPKYVDWPDEAFAQKDSPFVIGVLGETKLTGELQKTLAARTINGRAFVLRQLDSAEGIGVCHILFISAEKQPLAPGLCAKLKNTSVLTVGESGDFLEAGGIMNFARRDQKIALEINLTAATGARLKISSKLLGVASVVKGKVD